MRTLTLVQFIDFVKGNVKLMTDVHTKAQRSRNMAAIRGKNTKPELIVRSLLHNMGYRFRIHRSDLPGKPDIVLSSRRKIILVHGCYWHMHHCRFGRVVPATNTKFWQTKRRSNVRRDQANQRLLKKSGWKVLTVWECSLKKNEQLCNRIRKFLGH